MYHIAMKMICEKFYYDESSPSGLRWKEAVFAGRQHTSLMIQSGEIAGSVNKGRWQVTIRLNGKNKTYQVSRIVLELHGIQLRVNQEVDHVDGNPLNNKIENLRVVSKIINQRNKKKYSNNKTGKSGVQTLRVKGRYYLVSVWKDLNGKRKSKCFSVDNLGYDTAFDLASKFRDKMISLMNEKDAGYTERHGF